jgi:hypothetical protein
VRKCWTVGVDRRTLDVGRAGAWSGSSRGCPGSIGAGPSWICCHAAWSASATSASSPTANVPGCCRSASACLRLHQSGPRAPLNTLHDPPLFRSVHTAAQRCTSSNGSPRLNCWFVLHRSRAGKPHEPTTSALNRLGASPSMPVLRHNKHMNRPFFLSALVLTAASLVMSAQSSEAISAPGSDRHTLSTAAKSPERQTRYDSMPVKVRGSHRSQLHNKKRDVSGMPLNTSVRSRLEGRNLFIRLMLM